MPPAPQAPPDPPAQAPRSVGVPPSLRVVRDPRHTDQARPWRWQLVARNGRLLAMGEHHYPDASAAHADFAVAVDAARAETLNVIVSHSGRGVGWLWRIDASDGSVVLRAHRSYERYDSCRRAGHRLLLALRAAESIAR